jgi:hypothetical protein
VNAVTQPVLSIEAFENGSIDPDTFDHEAHIHVAWLYLERFELPDAIGKFDAALRRLTLRLGIPRKYHATITWFFLLLISERRAASPGADWRLFRCRNEDIFSGGDILRRHYTTEVLASDRARRTFVLPDRVGA